MGEINNQSIIEIEGCINEYKEKIDSLKVIVKNPLYENIVPLKFLPGHKATLLVIPKLIEGIQKHKKSEKNNADEEKIKTVKEELIEKLKKFTVKQNLNINITEENLIEFRVEKGEYKCKVKCAVCEKLTPCNFNTHWAVSNLEKHLKGHKELPDQLETETEAEPNSV